MAEAFPFETLEDREDASAGAADLACSSCGAGLSDAFYEVNSDPFCEPCAAVVYERFLGGNSWRTFGRAAAFGAVGGVLGSIFYWSVVRLTGLSFGFLAIVVGLMVGRAVKAGCRGRGGRPYQFLAVFLTYSALVSATIPRLVEMVRLRQAQDRSANALPRAPNRPAANFGGRFAGRPRFRRPPLPRPFYRALLAAVIVLIAYLLPLLLAWDRPVMLLVIFFGLWEACKINRKVPLRMEGPFYPEDEQDEPSPEAMPGVA